MLPTPPPVQAESSEDEGPAVAGPEGGSGGPKGGRGGAKGGRELKRLQMWAWERRGRESSSEDEDASGMLRYSGAVGGY